LPKLFGWLWRRFDVHKEYFGNNIFDGNSKKLGFQTSGHLTEFRKGISFDPRIINAPILRAVGEYLQKNLQSGHTCIHSEVSYKS
jgi:hypothetical protein